MTDVKEKRELPDLQEDEISYLNGCIAVAAGTVSRTYRGFTEQLEVHQVLWEWVLKHRTKLERWAADNDDDGYQRVLGYTLLNEGNRFARRAKAAALGYAPGDEFFYTKSVIQELLPTVFNKDEWVNPPTDHGNGKSGKALNEGNNWLATLSDIARAFALLSEDDQWLLRAVYETETPQPQLAELFGISVRGVEHRVDRSTKRLWRHLGGPKWLAAEKEQGSPTGSRHVISNATARVITSKDWDNS